MLTDSLVYLEVTPGDQTKRYDEEKDKHVAYVRHKKRSLGGEIDVAAGTVASENEAVPTVKRWRGEYQRVYVND